MTRKTKTYTKEFKEETVKLALSSESISAVAKELGIPQATLFSWIAKAKSTGKAKIETTDGKINTVDVTKLLEENKQLHKKLARLEQEKAILKKAATFFAKELE